MSNIILLENEKLKQVKEEIPGDLEKARTAIFYIGDTGMDGKLCAHIGGNADAVISMLVSAGAGNDIIRQMLLITATHLK